MNYRKDIDGLRAVAVLAVIAFHGYGSWFPQGYRGVDIFFVISGFLITSIIVHGLEKGTFSFLNFYVRRVKRIFPMAYLVLAIISLIGALTLFANEFEYLKKCIRSAAGFYINFQFVKDSGYFDTQSAYKPLLHYWSLAIEEQFYLLWPFSVYLIHKTVILITKKVKNSRASLDALGAFAFLGILASFVHFYTLPESHYFASSGRAWELLTGCFTAVLLIRMQRSNKKVSTRVSNFLGNLGLLLITLGFVFDFFKVGIGFSVCGTALYLYSSEDLKLKSFFKNKLMVYFGLISFSLYLWHWPLLSFYRIYDPNVGVIGVTVLISIAIALSSISYYLIEEPLKAQNWDPYFGGRFAIFDARMILAKVVPCLTAAILILFFSRDFPKLKDIPKNEFHIIEDYTFGFKNECLVGDIKDNYSLSWCYKDPISKKFQGVVLGDSHAHALFPGLTEISKEIDWQLIANHSCSPFVLNDIYTNCREVISRATDELMKKNEIKYVLLVSANRIFSEVSKELDSPEGREKTIKNLKRIVSSGKTVIILEPVPEVAKNIYSCAYQRFPFYEVFKSEDICRTPLLSWNERTAPYLKFLNYVKEQVPEVVLVDPLDKLCDSKYCHAARNGHILYYDSDHLSLYGSEIVAEKIVASLKHTSMN
jgi:peptidoglycan/LPS O-acetylase OafA/YrhL